MAQEPNSVVRDGIVLRICRGPSCGHLAPDLERAALSYIEQKGLQEHVGLAKEFCFGRCSMGPNMVVERWRDGARNDKAMFSLMMNIPHPDLQPEHGLRPADIPRLIDSHLRAWRRQRNA